MNITIWYYLLIINILAFGAYGIDKWKAKTKKWRIPESTLLGFAALGGALGCFLGMQIFRHKTQHTSFRIIVPLCLVLWIGILAYLIFFQ